MFPHLQSSLSISITEVLVAISWMAISELHRLTLSGDEDDEEDSEDGVETFEDDINSKESKDNNKVSE